MTAATAVRPGDQATRTILAMQDEMTALGLLPRADGTTGREAQGCGTEAAARRHRRNGEPACSACLRAETAAHRARETLAADAEKRARERDRARLQRWRARNKDDDRQDAARAARLAAAEASAAQHYASLRRPA